MSVSIVTDSGSDYTFADAQRAGIDIVPIILNFDGERLRDGVDIDRSTFYSRVRASKELPGTEPPPIADYEAVFGKHVNAGRDVVCIALSSQLSKTCENARTAAARFPGRVFVVDALSAAASMVLQCEFAATLASEGTNAAQIAERMSASALKRISFFAMPDVAPLGRSGRLPKPLVALGSMLNVSLMLKIDEKGAIGPAGQSRSFEKTCEIMVDALVRAIGHSPNAHLAISHAGVPALATSLKAQIEGKLDAGYPSIRVYETAPTLVSHLGLGAVGVLGIVP